MSKRSVSRRGLWATFKRQLRLIAELMRDARVPLWMRAIPVLGFLYLISPIELLPDISLLPFGILDDLVVILVCLTIFMAIAPQDVVDDHVSWIDAADITVDDLQDARRRLPPGGKKD
jgi:uncharacterized membrane protein YkvA (DUF1232 family)